MLLLDVARVAFGLIAVLAMIGIAAWSAQRFGVSARGTGRRMSLVEVLPLDARRKAAILRCDGRDHLIILGSENVCLVDKTIAVESTEAVKPAFEAPFGARGAADVDPAAVHPIGLGGLQRFVSGRYGAVKARDAAAALRSVGAL